MWSKKQEAKKKHEKNDLKFFLKTTTFTCESHTLTNWIVKSNPMPLDTLVVH